MDHLQKPIYISGQITNLSPGEVEYNFRSAENLLREMGFTKIVNPLDIDHQHNGSWENYMLKDIEHLFGCETVLMLHNWKDSKGARIEHCIAIEMGKNIIYEARSKVEVEKANS